MLVAGCVHPLVGRHGEEEDLIDLADTQTRDPDTVEQGHDHHEEHPGRAEGGTLQVVEIGLLLLLGVGTGSREVLVAAPGEQEGQEREEKQIEDEVVVVLLPDTVAHPGTVMVEPGDAPITHGAMLGPDGSPDEAGAAEDDGVEPVVLRQLDESPVLDLLASSDDPWQILKQLLNFLSVNRDRTWI